MGLVNTLAKNRDPLDILVIATVKTFPDCIINTRLIGYFDMVDSERSGPNNYRSDRL